MTQEELAESIDRAVEGFSSLEGVETELAERLVEEGFLSYDDLSIIEPDNLMEMGSFNEAQVDKIVAQAEAKAEEAEAAAAAARRQKREDDRKAALEAGRKEAEESAHAENADNMPDTSSPDPDGNQTEEGNRAETEEVTKEELGESPEVVDSIEEDPLIGKK